MDRRIKKEKNTEKKKKFIKRKKGFTLVELLVTIVILGIVTSISIPIVKNISKGTDSKKYITYSESLLNGAKLYNNSYSEDLFGNHKNGCAYISYQQLKTKDLIKDIQIDGMTCNTDNTFVRVVKTGDKYSYKAFLGCGKSKDEITKILPTNEENETEPYIQDSKYCGGINGTDIRPYVKPEPSEDTNDWKKERKVTIGLESFLGIDSASLDIKYTWATRKGLQKEFEPIPGYETYKQASFNVPSNSVQDTAINNGNAIIVESEKEIATPSKYNGKIYLLVKIDGLKDKYGTSFSPEINNSYIGKDNILAFGPYGMDNEKPKVEITSIETKNNNNKKTIVKFKASDTYTPNNKLKFCLTIQDSKVCTPKLATLTTNQIEKTTEEAIYGQVEYDFSQYNGSKVTVRVFAQDLAGNVGEGSKEYQLPNTYTLTYKDTKNKTNNNCHNTKKEVSAIVGNGTTWGTLCKPNKISGKQFEGWYTEDNGGGDLITENTPVNGKLTAYAKWRDSKIIFRFQTYDGEDLTPTTTSGNKVYDWKLESDNGKYYYIYRSLNKAPYELYTVKIDPSATSVTLPKYNDPNGLNITKTGLVAFTGKEWSCVSNCKNGLTFKAGSATTIKSGDLCTSSGIDNGDCYVTVKVNWNENKVKIKLNANGVKNVTGRNGYSVNANGQVLKNSGQVIHEISYGGSLTSQGLLNYNNSNYLNLTRNGYSVPSGSEWNTKPDGTGTSYNQDTVYRASDFCDASQNDCEVTLYLNWQKNPTTYKVKYNLNGGSGTFSEQTKTENINLTLHSGVPTRSGYTFKGWLSSSDQKKYQAGSSYGKNAETTMTAQWEANQTQPTSGYIYRTDNNIAWRITGDIPTGGTYYNSYEELVAHDTKAKTAFLRHKVTNGKLDGVSVGFVINGNIYYMSNRLTTEEKRILESSLPSNCFADDEIYLYCEYKNLMISIDDAYADVYEVKNTKNDWGCLIDKYNGRAFCDRN